MNMYSDKTWSYYHTQNINTSFILQHKDNSVYLKCPRCFATYNQEKMKQNWFKSLYAVYTVKKKHYLVELDLVQWHWYTLTLVAKPFESLEKLTEAIEKLWQVIHLPTTPASRQHQMCATLALTRTWQNPSSQTLSGAFSLDSDASWQ